MRVGGSGNKRVLAATGAVVAASVAALGLQEMSMTDDGYAAGGSEPQSQVTTGPARGAPTVATLASVQRERRGPRPLSPKTIARIEREGTTVRVVEDREQFAGELSSLSRILAPRREAGNPDSEVEASLAYVTITGYGRELESDPNLPSRLDLIVEDRLAWVLHTHGMVPMLSGPMRSNLGDDDRDSKLYEAHMFLVFDARTGEFLSGESM